MCPQCDTYVSKVLVLFPPIPSALGGASRRIQMTNSKYLGHSALRKKLGCGICPKKENAMEIGEGRKVAIHEHSTYFYLLGSFLILVSQ